jgi:hypothetical protein
VYWVRDSIAHLLIGESPLEEGEYGERINWDEQIEYDDENMEIFGGDVSSRA